MKSHDYDKRMEQWWTKNRERDMSMMNRFWPKQLNHSVENFVDHHSEFLEMKKRVMRYLMLKVEKLMMMKNNRWLIIIHYFISCSSWLRSMSWWHWQIGSNRAVIWAIFNRMIQRFGWKSVHHGLVCFSISGRLSPRVSFAIGTFRREWMNNEKQINDFSLLQYLLCRPSIVLIYSFVQMFFFLLSCMYCMYVCIL